MARLPPLNALRAFEVSGRHLNFRRAAEEIGVTQGAVAQQVRSLEARLKVRLFDRLPRGLALTEDGRKYLAPVTRAFALIESATDELRPGQSILTISVPPSFAARWLVPRLGRFTRDNPQIDVRIVASDRLANFQDDGVDMAVRQGRPPAGPGLVADVLFPAKVLAVCSPELLDGDHPLRTVEDLAHHVLLHDAHGLWPVFLERAFAGSEKPKTRAMNFSQTSLAIDAALAGQGVALASDFLVQDELRAGRLCRPFDLTIDGDFGFFVVAPRTPRHPELVSRMRTWLLSQASAPG